MLFRPIQLRVERFHLILIDVSQQNIENEMKERD